VKIQSTTRQVIIQDLIEIGCIPGSMPVSEFIRRVYPKANNMPTTDHRFGMTNAIDDIHQHMDNNNDWTFQELFFSYLDLLKVPDSDFIYFLEQYVHPTIRRSIWNPDTEEIDSISNDICVAAINKYLKDDGYELQRTGSAGDLPIYKIQDTSGGITAQIKNIIFASKYKPDIVLSDAIGNEISIVGNADQCLVYDQPITSDGLTWRQLESWYDTNGLWIAGDADLSTCLRKSLGSVAEESFYDAYTEVKDQMNGEIPALLPQVWLYYDPKLETDRIKKIFEHQRMDFLMLISDTKRIVVEIDGKQHYGEMRQINGRQYPDYIASADKYAAMVSAQRDLTLAGYEVYRFGGKELSDEAIGKQRAKSFFNDLFRKYRIIE
jgi:hypothetical protein